MKEETLKDHALIWYKQSLLLGIGAIIIPFIRTVPRNTLLTTLIVASLMCAAIPNIARLNAMEKIPTVTHRDTTVHLTAPLPEIGTLAPDFLLVDIDLSEVSLKDYAGMKKILNIVPSLDTPVCALSAKKFNEEVEKLENTVIINISMDLPFANKRFCDLEALENIRALSAFRAPHFGFAYGVRMKNGVLAGLFARSIIILDEENIVRYVELVPNVGNEPNYEHARAALLDL